MPIVIETEQEFAERHGNDRVKIETNLWAFADGAMMRQGMMNVECYNPADDPRSRLEIQRRFERAKLNIFESGFDALKSALLGDGNAFHWQSDLYGADPGGDGIPALLQLQGLATEHRRRLATIVAEIEQLPEVRAAREHERYLKQLEAEYRQRESAFHERVAAVTLDDHEDVSAMVAETSQSTPRGETV